MLARSAACGRRSLVRRLTGRLIRLRGSAPLLRTPPAARAFSPLLASWASGPRFCLPRSVLRPWRLAAARARPRPLLWAVFGPRLCSLLACAPSPRRIASRARLARFPPCSALASAGRLPGPGLGVAPAGGSAVRPPVGLCVRCWLLPRLVFCPPPPPLSQGSWFGIGSGVLRGASAAQGALSRAEMWTEGDKLDSTHRARIDRPGAATAPKQPSPVGYQLRY